MTVRKIKSNITVCRLRSEDIGWGGEVGKIVN
jgi:hypothetical protein